MSAYHLLSRTAFHSAVVCSFERLIICFAFPFLTKSACNSG